MAVYAKGAGEASQTISFDIYQGEAHKQTVTISIVRMPELTILIDGKRVRPSQQ